MKKFKNFIYKIIENDINNNNYENIRTRFAPEPNGLLHLGHAKAIILNYEIANYFNGQCNLRFDDTNPSVENNFYINNIIKDIKWLGYNCSERLFYTSDYFDKLFKFAIILIKKNLAYVDELPSSKLKLLRGTLTKLGQDSPYRYRTIKENLIAFQKMKHGEFKEGKACLRAKIDMKSKYYILRDPIIYRIKYIAHHNTNFKWCIYPMYDFAHCLSDTLEQITHSLCTMEFQDNRRLYYWILNNLNIKNMPKQYEYARLNLAYNIMSKRKLNILVKHKLVNGWDDPRMITLAGLRRRGYTPYCLKKFCNQIGISRQENRIPYTTLEAIIRKNYNMIAYRIMAVVKPIKVIIDNVDKNYILTKKVLNIPHQLTAGYRIIKFSKQIYISFNDFEEKIINILNHKRLILGQEVKLRYIPILITLKKIIKHNNGKINYLLCSSRISEQHNNIPIIQWVSKSQSLPIICYLYSNLFTIINPDLNKQFVEYLNKKSLIKIKGRIENNILNNIYQQSIYQFERLGYFSLDKQLSTNNINLVFNLITKLHNNYYL